MDFEQYWKEFGELHASMCGGDIKQFAKEIWGSATSHNTDHARCNHDMIYPTDGSTPQCRVCGKEAG